MARPRVSDEERRVTAVRLPVSVARQLREAARQRDVSVNLLVQRAVEDLLRRLPDVDLVLPSAEAPRGSEP